MTKIKGLTKLILIGLLFLTKTYAQPKILEVNKDEYSKFSTITDALASASDGDVIKIYGTFTGEGVPINGIIIDKSVTIIGEGVDFTKIEASLFPADDKINQRVLTIMEGKTVVLESLTIRNGYLNSAVSGDSKGGAGIKNLGNLILRNCALHDNLIQKSNYFIEGGILNSGNGKSIITGLPKQTAYN